MGSIHTDSGISHQEHPSQRFPCVVKESPLASGWDSLRPNIDVQAEGKAVAAGGQVSGAVCVDSDGVRWDRGWEGTVRGTLSSHRRH